MRVLLILFAGILFTFPLFGQSGCHLSISGQVIDEHNSRPLPFANAFLLETGQGAATDESGRFELKNLCPGVYRIRLSHIGCENRTVSLDLRSDTLVQFELEHHSELLETITIQESATNRAALSQSESTLSEPQLQQLQGKSIGETLTSISGVSALQTGSNIFKPIIHGLHSSRILILNQGVRIEGQEWGTDHAPEVDPMAAEQITVVKGVAAVRYGIGAMGGAILVDNDLRLPDRSFKGRVGLIGQSNGRSATANIKVQGLINSGLGWMAQGSYKRGGDLHAPDYNLTNTGIEELNFSGGLVWSKNNWTASGYYSRFSSRIGILRASHIGNLTDLEDALERDTPLIVEDFSYKIDVPRQEVVHQLAKFSGSYKWEGVGKLSAVYSYQDNDRQEYDIRRGGRSDKPALDMDLKSYQAELVFEHQPWKKLFSGSLGIQSNIQRNRNIPDTGVEPLIPWYNRETFSAFWMERLLLNRFQLEAGLRFDYQDLFVKTFDSKNELLEYAYNFTGWSALVGGYYRMDENWKLAGNLGYTFRPPNISELFSDGLHHGVSAIERGDPDLDSEQGLKAVGGFNFQQEKVKLKFDVYTNWIEGYIFLFPEDEPELTIRGAFPVFSYRQTDAHLYGFDLSSQFILPYNLDLRFQAALVRGNDLLNEEPLIYIPADRLDLELGYQITGNRQWKDTRFWLGMKLVAEQTRFPPDSDFAPPPDGYSLIRAGVNTRLHFNGSDLNLSLTIENFFNTSYRAYLDRQRYYADAIGRNFILRLQYAF